MRVARQQLLASDGNSDVGAAEAALQMPVRDALPRLLLLARCELSLDTVQVVAMRTVEQEELVVARVAFEADSASCIFGNLMKTAGLAVTGDAEVVSMNLWRRIPLTAVQK